MGKPIICIGGNKGADQLRDNREADQRLCFGNTDCSTPFFPKSEISQIVGFLIYRLLCHRASNRFFVSGDVNICVEILCDFYLR